MDGAADFSSSHFGAGFLTFKFALFNRAFDGRTDIEFAVKANYVQVNNSQQSCRLVTDELAKEFDGFWKRHAHQPLVGRDDILSSFCPQVSSNHQLKRKRTVDYQKIK